jgi:hypothetical protein
MTTWRCQSQVDQYPVIVGVYSWGILLICAQGWMAKIMILCRLYMVI